MTNVFDNLKDLPIGRRSTSRLEATLGLNRTQALTMLPIDRIVPNPEQPRRHFSPSKMEDLVTSVRERGVLQAIRVREIKTQETYEIIAGERRWRAAKEAGLTEIPALVVRDQTPEQAFVDALIENVVREDLNPIDRAEALVRVRVHLGARSWDELAQSKKVGLNRRQIFHLLGLTSLPESVKDDIRSGALTEKHGRALRSLKDEPQLLDRALDAIKSRRLSGDEALQLVKELRDGTEITGAPHVFRVRYRTEAELIAILETKLSALRADLPALQ
jgi:ParB family chromosome partitioning protein